MKRQFTNDDIIRFLYNEMDSEEAEVFLDAVCVDEKLWERYEYFQNIVDMVPNKLVSPSQDTLSAVMDYAASKPSVNNKAILNIPFSWLNTQTSLNTFLLFLICVVGSTIIGFSIYYNISNHADGSEIVSQQTLSNQHLSMDSALQIIQIDNETGTHVNP